MCVGSERHSPPRLRAAPSSLLGLQPLGEAPLLPGSPGIWRISFLPSHAFQMTLPPAADWNEERWSQWVFEECVCLCVLLAVGVGEVCVVGAFSHIQYFPPVQ